MGRLSWQIWKNGVLRSRLPAIFHYRALRGSLNGTGLVAQCGPAYQATAASILFSYGWYNVVFYEEIIVYSLLHLTHRFFCGHFTC